MRAHPPGTRPYAKHEELQRAPLALQEVPRRHLGGRQPKDAGRPYRGAGEEPAVLPDWYDGRLLFIRQLKLRVLFL